MGAFAGWQLFVLTMILLTLYPVGRILGRLGYSPWWALLAMVSPLNVIGLWILAFARWPVEDAGGDPPRTL